MATGGMPRNSSSGTLEVCKINKKEERIERVCVREREEESENDERESKRQREGGRDHRVKESM